MLMAVGNDQHKNMRSEAACYRNVTYPTQLNANSEKFATVSFFMGQIPTWETTYTQMELLFSNYKCMKL